MSMLKDPDMLEIVDEFCVDSEEIYTELEEMLEEYEDGPDPAILEKFGQTIDRVMGAAKSLEANQVGLYCELGKTISYKASQSKDPELLNIVVAVLFDAVELLQKMNKCIKTLKEESTGNMSSDAFATRLRWLAEKFNDIQRSSVAIDESESTEDKLSSPPPLTLL